MEIGSLLVLYLYTVLFLWSSGYAISSTYRETETGSPVVDSGNQGPSLPASPASLFQVNPDISESANEKPDISPPLVESANLEPSVLVDTDFLFQVHPDLLSVIANEKPNISPLLVDSANKKPSLLGKPFPLFKVHPDLLAQNWEPDDELQIFSPEFRKFSPLDLNTNVQKGIVDTNGFSREGMSILKKGLNGAYVFNGDPVFNEDKSLTRLDFANDFNTDKVITGSDSNAFGTTIPKPATVSKCTPFNKTHSSLSSETNPSGGNAFKERDLNGVRYAPLTKRNFIGTKYAPLTRGVPVDYRTVGLDRRYDHYLGLNVSPREKSDHYEPDDEITVYSHYRRAPSSLPPDRVDVSPIVKRGISHLKKRDLFSIFPHDIDKREEMSGNQRRRTYTTKGNAILFKRSADKFGQSDLDNPMLRPSRLVLFGRTGAIENDGGRVHSRGKDSRVTQDGTLKFRADGPPSNFVTDDVGAVVTDRTTDDGERADFTQTDELLNIRAYGGESVGLDKNENDWKNELEASGSDDLEEAEEREDGENELERRTGGAKKKKKKNKKKKMPKKKKKKKGGKSKG